jgi:aminomethyltransferase
MVESGRMSNGPWDASGYVGLLRLRGATRLDFVHRMSSGEVRKLVPGAGATTCFTTPIGRIVDYTLVLCESDSLLLLTGGGNADALARWLRKYIFFNDDVTLADETASAALSLHALDDAPVALRSETATRGSHLESAGARWARVRFGDGDLALRIGVEPAPGLAPVDALDALRIGRGQPRFPNEFNGDVIPLEGGVWGAVSFNKGCYIGQEIIARMESRNQIAKKLVRLERVAGAVSRADALTADDAPVGTITSAHGDHALGYVRSMVIEKGKLLNAPNAQVRIADVVRL